MSRAIVHVDLDAFYAQVEQVRLGISSDVPLAVQQWQGLIAVNYAARKYNVKRSTSAIDAKKLAPDLRLVHVATFANLDTIAQYHDNPTYQTHKVCLDYYRKASQSIMKIFLRFCDSIERGSIDEAFFDVTDLVNAQIASGEYKQILKIKDDPHSDSHVALWTKDLGVLVGPSIEISHGRADLQLCLAAHFTKNIRQAVYDELGYTCSAGIAHNKTLAKLCSALNKPNNQTVLRSEEVLHFMKNLPLQKIRNLGGKFGDSVESDLNATIAGDIWQYSIDALKQKFGDAQGVWLYNISRGVCDAKVLERNAAKSMGATKAFRPPVKGIVNAFHWVSILASELFARVHYEFDTSQRWPKTLTLHSRKKSKSCPFPGRFQMTSPSDINKRGCDLLTGLLGPDPIEPIYGISMILSQFVKMESGNPSIRNFYAVKDTIDTTTTNTASKQDSDAQILNQTYQCEKCQKRINFDHSELHNDFHFASELQSELQASGRVEDRLPTSSSIQQNASLHPTKKRKSLGKASGKSNGDHRLTDYFKKVEQ